MHDLLRPENLSLLPPNFQALAKAARDGSLHHFQLLRLQFATLAPSRDERYIHCLPVPFALLDPARIPTGENVNTPAVQLAIEALMFLRMSVDSESPAWPDLWPRVWTWIDFLHTHRRVLPLPSGEPAWRFLLRFTSRWLCHAPTAELICSTVGVRSLIVHVWMSLVNSAEVFDSEDLSTHLQFSYLCDFIRGGMHIEDAANFSEVLEAAGGLSGLASLVVRSIIFCIPNHQTVVRRDAFFLFYNIMNFILQLETIPENIYPSFVSAGIVPVFTSAVCAISNQASAETEFADGYNLLVAFGALQIFLDVTPSYKSIGDALGAGLLQAIVYTIVICKNMDEGCLKTSPLFSLVANTLPTSTVYHTVVSQLEEPLLHIQFLELFTPSFKKSPIYIPWKMFENLAEERIQIMKRIESKEEYSRKACYSLQCGVIEKKIEFRRCAQCLYAYYCSKECQKQDWKHGGHRQACPSIRDFRLRTQDLSPRNLSFMRAVLHQENEHWTTAALKGKGVDISLPPLALRLVHMEKYPLDPPVVVFDHTGNSLRTTVVTATEERARDVDGDVLWDEHIARVKRSGGRMELHLLIVRDGKRRRRYMFSQRRDSSVVQDGLMNIVEGNLRDSHNALQDLWEESKKGVAIHE
ncbi:MYND-type domain-containing protein [Mycena sanguinolenta]|uniref:MYND-type domain-containing protein n=1 Tax=Mycena sanguinolenta TaxID=230812 RepID=A0A8H7DGR0_9AGAR|nr:MYND-type domain-containing protein [Mycena sanguinolenta]